MSNLCVKNQYYSGQGSLSLGQKDPITGRVSGGLRPVGNVSALNLGITTSEFEHKESCTGARATDLTITTEITVAVNMTLESLSKENLALAVNGTDSVVASGTATDEQVIAAVGFWMPLSNIRVSAVTVTSGDGATTYDEGTDYTVDEAAGMICVEEGGNIPDGTDLLVDYSFDAYDSVQGFTSGAKPIRWARFAGLNTADEDKPVIVDIFRLQISPLTDLALINDQIAQMQLTSNALSDSTRQKPNSRFFQIMKAA